MSNEELDTEVAPADPTIEEIEEAQEPQRSLWGLLALVIAVVVVVVVLLMLRGCGGSSALSASRAGKTIEAVKGHDPVSGSVSLWVAEGKSVDTVLRAADVEAGGRLNLGEGRWVVDVAPGTEARAIKALGRQEGVHDAGRVYER